MFLSWKLNVKCYAKFNLGTLNKYLRFLIFFNEQKVHIAKVAFENNIQRNKLVFRGCSF